MENKLTKLGLYQLDNKSKKVDISSIKKLEKLLEITLPDDYKSFLKSYGHTMVFENDVQYKDIEKSPWTSKDGFSGLELFYGFDDDHYNILKKIETYKGRIPDYCISIGDAPGGNQILLGIKDEDYYGKVYFWDHESRGVKKNHVYFVADSFQKFIDSLELVQS